MTNVAAASDLLKPYDAGYCGAIRDTRINHVVHDDGKRQRNHTVDEGCHSVREVLAHIRGMMNEHNQILQQPASLCIGAAAPL
jgi:hypothetical protein